MFDPIHLSNTAKGRIFVDILEDEFIIFIEYDWFYDGFSLWLIQILFIYKKLKLNIFTFRQIIKTFIR